MSNKEKKQAKAFRLTEETAEKFKEIAQDMGANQQQALARLIEVYETEMGKESFPEMREDIDTFEGYIRAAANMYLQALESVQNMRALVRTEYDTQLKSKDKSIAELQERVEIAEYRVKEATDNESDYKVLIDTLNKENDDLKNSLKEEREEFKERLEESKKSYSDLSNSYTKLQITESNTKSMLSKFMEENQELKMKNIEFIEERQSFDSKLQDLVCKNQTLQSDLEREKQRYDEVIKKQEDSFMDYKKRTQTEYQLELQLKINELQQSHKSEFDEVRKELDKYKELYFQIVSKNTKK